MDSMSPIRDQMSALYGASTDIPHVMGVAVDLLADLHHATVELGNALVDAGLPQRAWRSEQATLRLLSPALPAITIATFLTRLQQFTQRDGPRWLQGTRDELVVFHRGIVIVVNVARPLQEVVDRLPPLPVDMPGRPRDNRGLQHVMRHRALHAPLDTIVAILNELEALAPSMRPLTPEQWRAVRRGRRGTVARLQGMVAAWVSGLQIRWRRGAPSSSAAASEAAPGGASAIAPGAANAHSVFGMGGAPELKRPSLARRLWLRTPTACDESDARTLFLGRAHSIGWLRRRRCVCDGCGHAYSHAARHPRADAQVGAHVRCPGRNSHPHPQECQRIPPHLAGAIASYPYRLPRARRTAGGAERECTGECGEQEDGLGDHHGGRHPRHAHHTGQSSLSVIAFCSRSPQTKFDREFAGMARYRPTLRLYASIASAATGGPPAMRRAAPSFMLCWRYMGVANMFSAVSRNWSALEFVSETPAPSC
jgi:hypothetical protein